MKIIYFEIVYIILKVQMLFKVIESLLPPYVVEHMIKTNDTESDTTHHLNRTDDIENLLQISI